MPRSMSFAPSSTITASVSSETDQADTGEAAGGGVAGDARIGDVDADPFRGKRLGEFHRKHRVRRQAEARDERIAERDDLHRPVGGGGGRGKQRRENHDTGRRHRGAQA